MKTLAFFTKFEMHNIHPCNSAIDRIWAGAGAWLWFSGGPDDRQGQDGREPRGARPQRGGE